MAIDTGAAQSDVAEVRPKAVKASTAALLSILLLAFALRMYNLDGQSLWADEGASAVMTGRTVTQILDAAAGDIHPPLYYLALRFWSVPMGASEFALRFLSVAFGLLLVVLVFKLGQNMLGRVPGLIAALLTAVSPFAIYYSQEARMYSLMAMLAILSTYLFWRLMQPDGNHKIVIPSYVLATAALLYTQYFAATIVLVENLTFVLLSWPWIRRRALWLEWIGAQLAILALYLPWVIRASDQLRQWATGGEQLTIAGLLQKVLIIFSLGRYGDVLSEGWMWLTFLLLFAIGILSLLFLRPRALVAASVLLILYLLIPVAVIYWRSIAHSYEELKMLLPVAPIFYLIIASGIMGVASVTRRPAGSRSSAVLSGVCLLGIGYLVYSPLHAYYFNHKYARDDYRGIVQQIQRQSRPEDAVLLNSAGQIEIFSYYYKGDLSLYPMPKERPPKEEPTLEELKTISTKHGRLWAVLWGDQQSDPKGIIQGWLNQNAYRTNSRWFGNVQLVLYTLAKSEQGSTIQHPLKANFGDQVQLLGYSLSTDSGQAGGVLPITLFWQAQKAVDKRYKVFTHLIDKDEFIWGQQDSEPAGGTKPTVNWRPEDTIADRHGLPVSIGTPPGDYQIAIGLYDGATGARLNLIDSDGKAAGDRLVLDPVKIEKGAIGTWLDLLTMANQLNADFGELRLLGYELTKQGVGPATEFNRGEFALVTLYWQALSRPAADYQVLVELRNERGVVVWSQQGSPVQGLYPTSKWDQDELVRDQNRLFLDLPPGQYSVLVGVNKGYQNIRPNAKGRPVLGDLLEISRVTIR